jgi:hypothetical protein
MFLKRLFWNDLGKHVPFLGVEDMFQCVPVVCESNLENIMLCRINDLKIIALFTQQLLAGMIP